MNGKHRVNQTTIGKLLDSELIHCVECESGKFKRRQYLWETREICLFVNPR